MVHALEHQEGTGQQWLSLGRGAGGAGGRVEYFLFTIFLCLLYFVL